MKVWEIAERFGLENLRTTERAGPEPGAGQVLIRVRACALNYRDLMMVRGEYNPRQPLPLVPVSDGVGEVIAVGEGVTRVAVGDRVVGVFAQRWIAGRAQREQLGSTLGGPLDGMLAEKVVLSEEGVVRPPEHLSDEEAATLPCAATTAWSALVEQGQLRAGETVLVQGTGGVSLFALQIAKLAGARVIVTSSSDQKLERARALGADDTINYVSTPEWGKEVKRRTGNVGVDHVVEVGGGGTLRESVRAIRPGGTISIIGVLAGRATELDVTPILMQNVRLQGVLVGPREALENLCRAAAAHRLRPVVDRVFSFAEARAAFEHMQSGRHFGKIVVRM